MKIMHLSDLHLGKRVNEYSMIIDQEYILRKILNIIDEEKVDGVIIAGDVYDKSVPSTEAVTLFDDFLTKLSAKGLKVFVISGNHDSAERIAFGAKLMEKGNVYVSPVYTGKIEPITIEDANGNVNFYLVPFVKPANVRKYAGEVEINSYTDMMKYIIEEMKFNEKERNILVAHQMVTGASRCESEDISVGGLDDVNAIVFEGFDYVALGHIHGPQKIGKDTVRYCGTPLKYSFSEMNHKKSVSIVDIGEKGNVKIKEVYLKPLHDMKQIKGTYMELASKSYYENINTDDYMHVILTDEDDVPEAIGKLRPIYKNIMKLEYDNVRTRKRQSVEAADKIEKKTPYQLVEELFEMQNNVPMNELQKEITKKIIEELQEGV